MGQVADLIGAQGAAAAGVLGPAEDAWLEEGAIMYSFSRLQANNHLLIVKHEQFQAATF